MSVTVSNSKTVTRDVSPTHDHTTLTTLLATAVENLTVSNLKFLLDAVSRLPGGSNPAATVGSLF